MKNEKRKTRAFRLTSCLLALFFCVGTASSALTADELKLLLNEYYLYDISQEAMEETTINGVLEEIGDPYTFYYSPEEYALMQTRMTDQHIGGIGIRGNKVEEGMYIAEVLPNGAAEKNGIIAGDTIISVNGVSLEGQTIEQIKANIAGEVGTVIQLSIKKKNGTIVEYSFEREDLVIESVQSEMLDDGVAYIYCNSFTSGTNTSFEKAIDKHKANTDVWMIDLRNNPGGSAYTALESVGMFLDTINNSVIAYFENAKDEYIPLSISSKNTGLVEPVVVLTSNYSASASELFAGVVRDSRAGVIIGDRTFGKGIAQRVLDKEAYPNYFSDGDAVQITTYRYFTKRGNISHQIGIIPNLLVDPHIAPDVAQLLSAQTGNNMLRLKLGTWNWDINLDLATSVDQLPNFIALLEGLPPQADLYITETNNQWDEITVDELVEQYNLTEFQSRWFTDVSHCGYDLAINALGTYDILNGYGDGKFEPDKTMTRAEFCAMLIQAFHLTDLKKGVKFSDVPEDAWYADEVGTVAAWGLMNGVGDGAFDPEETLTTEQAITVLARAGIQYNVLLKAKAKQWNQEAHPELSPYSEWAQQWVWLMGQSQTDMLGRTENLLFDAYYNIDHEDPVLRAEVADMLFNLLTHVNLLPL